MYKLFSDGGSRGNPGIAATGYFLFGPKLALIDFGGEFLHRATNNQAEYIALINGLKLSKKNNVKSIECFLDSELIVKQLNGIYKAKNRNIKFLFEQARKLKENFEAITFSHIYREQNKLSDKMVNLILDACSSE